MSGQVLKIIRTAGDPIVQVNLAPQGAQGPTGATGPQGPAGPSGGSNPWVVKTSGYVAINGDQILCDTSGGAITITLPATPSVDNNVTIKSGYSAATQNVTIAGNGQSIQGISQNMIISTPNIQATFVYDGTSWRL